MATRFQAGDRVTGTYDGVPYAGQVIALYTYPACEHAHKHALVQRDDGTDINTFTDCIQPEQETT